MQTNGEFATKLRRIFNLLDGRGLDGLLLQQVSSFAWATCGGRSEVNLASSVGAAQLLITRKGRYLITSNLEETRYKSQPWVESQGWELCIAPWYADGSLLAHLSNGLRLGADMAVSGALDLSAEVSRLRSELTAPEMERMRALGCSCAQVIDQAARAIRPGMTEIEICADLGYRAALQEVQAITNIVASDERISAFRHPLSTHKPVERLAMLVLCGRRDGLVCTITRFVHFGPLDAELARLEREVAWIAAVGIHHTRPGADWGQVFEIVRRAYSAVGAPQEWVVHHQGGLAGYEPREFFARPGVSRPVTVGQAGVWNPSLGAARSVDTFLVTEARNELLTGHPDWPTLQVEVDGVPYLRPAILQVW